MTTAWGSKDKVVSFYSALISILFSRGENYIYLNRETKVYRRIAEREGNTDVRHRVPRSFDESDIATVSRINLALMNP